jgi:hypothetical protein
LVMAELWGGGPPDARCFGALHASSRHPRPQILAGCFAAPSKDNLFKPMPRKLTALPHCCGGRPDPVLAAGNCAAGRCTINLARLPPSCARPGQMFNRPLGRSRVEPSRGKTLCKMTVRRLAQGGSFWLTPRSLHPPQWSAPARRSPVARRD